MGWKNKWPEKAPKPEVEKLSDKEKLEILTEIENGIEASPVLTSLNFRVKMRRGRFYYEQKFDSEFIALGRITPLLRKRFMLDVKVRENSWSEVAKGNINELTDMVSGDTEGAFHGLGLLDASLRLAKKQGVVKLEITKKDATSFYYSNSDKECSVQEVLFHYFDVPIPVIAEPSLWYIYHRVPTIKEIDDDGHSILTYFSSSGYHGSFGGTCLYTKREGVWNIFVIKPSESKTIESALKWLKKRNWVSW